MRRILAYHRHEPGAALRISRTTGSSSSTCVRPVARAGLYAPGGRARYPSTVLMCAAPARVAGVDELVLCVPPGPDGAVAPETLAAAAIAGIDEVYRVGGAQAVAAMAFGTAVHSTGSTSSPDPGTATWPRPSARCRGSSASPPPSPGPRRWWWWPTTPPRWRGPPSTSWSRPSTAPTAWPGW